MSSRDQNLKEEIKPIIEEASSKIEIEYVDDQPPAEFLNNPACENIFKRFYAKQDETTEENTKQDDQKEFEEESKEEGQELEGKENLGKDGETEHLSNRQRKKLLRMTVAQLKLMVSHPEVVELHDPNSKDAKLLVHLKSYRNSVPVPGHWILKRKYLSAKRGIEKSRYVLPDYIEATGVAVKRDSYLQEEAKKSRKQKQRERVRPRLGKNSLDFRELHTAFFEKQTKPENLSIHGDIYYEGKEYEIDKSKYKPGHLSDKLREALDMAPLTNSSGAINTNALIQPPPWLFNMQRYGPPPSYPNLRIPGVNAPIPLKYGAQFGYQTNGWGQPAVDQV